MYIPGWMNLQLNPAFSSFQIRRRSPEYQDHLYGDHFIIYNMTGDVVLTGISENLAPILNSQAATGLYTL